MKFSSAALLMAAAMGASAHPSGHAHMHNKRANFVIANKPIPLPTTSSAPPPPPPAPTTSEAPIAVAAVPSKPPAPAPAPSKAPEAPKAPAPSSSPSSGSGEYKPFCGGNYKRATLEEIAYAGNLGAPGKYGCNLMMVDEGVADQYKYTTTFTNDGDDDQTCACFLKIGPKGLIDGFFNGNQALNFDLPVGGKRVLAADENTQGGCACGSNGAVPLTKLGQFASTWYEFDFGNESNGGWSGADASCLVSSALGLDIPGMNVCGHDTCSTIFPGGEGINAFLKGMEALDGLGLNITPGKARVEVAIGYKG
ncbi:hypothetical protein B0I35DRAFT_190169 [Stachybotrys elegans]|uniref:Allergen Asp f 4 n=1 Tax=Stachybotrys elegans TaxID=80388 RepID=A0A8K0WTK1_9HYPO|nr:hypothetical protein B0I35DRAFT_190169 [Stachybotrys elegans]